MWRGYVKDQLNLENVPKAFLKIKSFSVGKKSWKKYLDYNTYLQFQQFDKQEE